jgi:nucleoside-diphosphate-sugar epimerase
VKKILITGGAGFVGRHFVKRFLDNGDEVHCVDNVAPYTGGKMPNAFPLYSPLDYKNFHFHHEDCRTYFKRVKDTEFDYALHLAAMVGGRLMIDFNPLAVADDLSIDAEYWQWAKETKPKKTVTFSSSAAYPIKLQRREHYELLHEDMIKFETDLGMPDMSYGWAKLTTEYIGKLAFERHELKSVAYRPFSGYGEDQDDTYPFPSILKRAIANQDKSLLTVWGTGEQMRDFIHIEDCIDGVLATMDKIDNGDALNLSTGIYTSFKELARLAAEASGYTPDVRGLSDKPEGVFARGGDTAKQKALGFTYKTSLNEGVKKAVRYFSKP